jgi:glycosyltransferase involved in cell wall biosynthesis
MASSLHKTRSASSPAILEKSTKKNDGPSNLKEAISSQPTNDLANSTGSASSEGGKSLSRRLMIIVTDPVSSLLKKGELTPRYYNPGDLFSEVHIVMTTADKANPEALQLSVGRAEPFVHNLPLPRKLLLRTLGYRPWLLNRWADQGVQLAREIRPSLVRCYENSFNAFMGARIKLEFGVPMVISLHGNPDIDFRGPSSKTMLAKIRSRAHRVVEKTGIRYADYFIAVYEPILPYLKEHNVKHFSLIYNSVGYDAEPKIDYNVHEPLVHCFCVGRQQTLFKNPTHIVEAVGELENVQLTLVGTGDLHQPLQQTARDLHCEARCRFVETMPNEQVLREMHDTDIFVFNQISLGISKSIIEAALTGLPIIVNARPNGTTDELSGDWLIRVDDSKSGYLQGLKALLLDGQKREQLGRRAHAHAHSNWAPEELEREVSEIYIQLMEQGRAIK